MDPETNFDQVANVGISNGWITKITTEEITGKDQIDAKGHVVAPGFIDTHFHSLDIFAVKCGLRDGVTTGMDLEYGAWPIDPWYEAKKGKWPMNYGTLVSQEVIRMVVHDGLKVDGYMDATNGLSIGRNFAAKDGVNGWSVTKSNLEQMNRITEMLDEGLRQGALGMGVLGRLHDKGSHDLRDVRSAACCGPVRTHDRGAYEVSRKFGDSDGSATRL